MDITQPFVHRLTAYIIGMECFKNTELIKEHCKAGTPADLDFYQEVLQHLRQSLSSHVTDIIENRFYQSYLRFYKDCLKGERWDPPETLHERTDLSPAEYILDGEFKKTCEKRQPLTQVRLGIISHDIYSRIYTLLGNQVLPLPLLPENSKRERAPSPQGMKTA